MHLDNEIQIGGTPAKDLRNVLKRASFSTREFLKLVPDAKDNAMCVLHQLLSEGYVIKSHIDDSVYEPTLKGASLGNATLRRYSRKAADKAILEMLKRVQIVNTEQELAYVIEALRIFGSYIGASPDVGDVDVAYELRHWSLNRIEQDMREKSRKQAHQGQFKSFIDELIWPQEEVLRFLKHRSPLIRFHTYEEPEKLHTPFVVVFNRNKPAYQAKFLREKFNCTLNDLIAG